MNARANDMILVGDIGGSNTRLALANRRGRRVTLVRLERYVNAEAPGLAGLIRRFLADQPAPVGACLAVAGPTDGRQVRLTNLDWAIDAEALAGEFGLPCRLVNDFEAVAWGIDALEPSGQVALQAAVAQPGAVRLAIGPGTGLGVAFSLPGRPRSRPLPGEGGHVGFAPTDDEQMALLRFLQGLHGRVSVERILSGPGLASLYAFCREASGRPLKRARSPAEVTEAALAGQDAIAVWALRLFCRILGQTAGDLALAADCRGGVYLAGGIPPRIRLFLEGPDFLAGFRDKGRFSQRMEAMPVHLVLDPDIGLKGAALAAY